jgi:hypothetical protein
MTLQESSMRKKIEVSVHLSLNLKHFVAVRASVLGLKNSEGRPVTVRYEEIEVFSAYPTDPDLIPMFFFIAFGLFSISLFGFCWYYLKYKRTKKQLVYEMQEIKNAVHFSGMNLSVSDDTQQSIENKRVYVGIDETQGDNV